MAKPVRYFYDCEFIEDGRTIDLISIGIVCEDGREFYAESNEFNLTALRKNAWLMENVTPTLESVGVHPQHKHTIWQDTDKALPKENIKEELLKFVHGTWPMFWAWYGAYDHVALCQLFGKMIDLPSHFPMFTRDIRQHWEYKGRPVLPEQPTGKHNALEDARWNKVRFDFLEGI